VRQSSRVGDPVEHCVDSTPKADQPPGPIRSYLQREKHRGNVDPTSIGTKYEAGTIARYPYLPSASVLSRPRHSGPVRPTYSESYRPKDRGRRRRNAKKNEASVIGVGGVNYKRYSSPVLSVSHVLITAPGTGSPRVLSTRPSTYIYSPFPSDAIDSPVETVEV
jgi:hypothetical protein